MSEEPTHGSTTIRASKEGGGGAKWLLGAAAAVVLIGGGYFAWKAMAPGQDSTQSAYNDEYSNDPPRAGPVDQDQDALAESASTDESAASDSTTRRSSSARRSTAQRSTVVRADTVPEETIGITPVSLTTQDDDDIVVTAPRRAVWTSVPSERRLSSLYPQRARQQGLEGEASLRCTVLDGGALDCAPVSETESGFGNAALRVSRQLRHAAYTRDGRDAAGTPVNLRVVFRMEEGAQRG